MAKKKWDPDVKITPSDFFSSQMSSSQAELGRNDTYIGKESQRVIIGIPLPSFSLRYLFQNDCFPLSRMTELYGVSESCKSAMLYEMFRWHVNAGGGYILNLAEPRDSPDLRASIIGHASDVKFPTVTCNSIEDWQQNITGWLKQSRDMFSESGSCPFPAAIGVDSLTGVATRGDISAIWEKGHAEIGFAKAANIINTYCKFVFSELRVWPFSFIGVNHMKVSKDARGFLERKIPGGQALDYYATFKLRMHRRADIDRLDEAGRMIEFTMDKNSLGTAGERRSIDVPMKWNFDEAGVQTTWWDWHEASIGLINDMTATRKNVVLDITGLKNIDKSRRTADCTAVGLVKATWSEIGAAIEQDDAVKSALDAAHGIRKRRPFVAGIPYSTQMRDACAAGEIEEVAL